MRNAIKPVDQYKALAKAHWPPAPAYYPRVLVEAFQKPTTLNDQGFADLVHAVHSRAYWDEMIAFWSETKMFEGRIPYIDKAIDEYFEGDYISSIHVIVPQFEGAIRDYLKLLGEQKYRLESSVKTLKQVVLSRPAILVPRPVVDLIFAFIEDGSFLAETSHITDAGE